VGKPEADLDDAAVGDAGDDAIPLCPHCLHEIDSTTQLCAHCTAPVGAFATYDPFKQIASTGWMYRKAISEGTSGFAFAGIWIIFGPTTCLTVLALLYTAFGRGFVPSVDLLFTARFALLLLLTAVQVIILATVTRSYVRMRRRRAGHCERCSYNLRGLPEPRCPECGTAFEPPEFADETDTPG
jgi:predicted amidophosphoribosyltransferase